MDSLTNIVNGPCHLVGIGASAGGLEALQDFFDHLRPDNGAAYIVVQHLSPDYKTIMDELLGKHTKMPVTIAEDGTEIKADHVYVIAPGKNLTVQNGRLVLTDINLGNGLNLPVDILFHSVAQEYKHNTIGIILSGTGSDGSRGLVAIKEAGGVTMIQNPESARFDAMPLNAQSRVEADFVLPPALLAEQICEYLSHPMITQRETALRLALENRSYVIQEIFTLLKTEFNVDFALYRPTTIARRIERRMGIRGITEIEAYLDLLHDDELERALLFDDFLIGVTNLFRDPHAFATLGEKVVEKIILNATPGDEIRIWDVACSTGEEAFSLAILFCETMKKLNCNFPVKIFASDVDRKAIATASQGEYSQSILQDIKPEWGKKYFSAANGKVKIKSEIRRMVVFAVHDITRDPPFSNVNLTVCRNLLIYFNDAVQKKILSRLHYSLRRPGYLFLGASESLSDMAPYFRILSDNYRVFENIAESRVSIDMSSSGKKHERGMPVVSNLIRSHHAYNQSKGDITFIDKFIINNYLPVIIVLNLEFRVEYIHGDASEYLHKPRSGRVSTFLLDMLVDELRIPVSTALHRVEHEHGSFSFTDIRVKPEQGEDYYMTVEVTPVFREEYVCNYIVMFKEQRNKPLDLTENATNEHEAQAYDELTAPYQRIRELEDELSRNHNRLQVTVEELETTNEELQAANEELLVSNEELQSSNEEMQSMNEELYTLNSEYQHKITELTESNNDIQNLMKSTDIGIIFLDSDICIRRFTPNITDFVPLVDSDIGRPFFNFTIRFNYDNLERDIINVARGGNAVGATLHVPEKDEIYYIRIAPYIDHHAEIDGVVVTFTDVTEIIKTEKNLGKAIDMLRDSMNMHLSVDKERLYRVAVLDDDKIDCEHIERLLIKNAQSAYTVKVFNKFSELEVELKEQSYDVLLLDYLLGETNAIELMEKREEVFNGMPVVLMSAMNAIEEKTTEFDRFNVYDIVPKNELSASLLERVIRYAARMNHINHFASSIDVHSNRSSAGDGRYKIGCINKKGSLNGSK